MATIKLNLQNIPIKSELGRWIREGFISKGSTLKNCDFAKLELQLYRKPYG